MEVEQVHGPRALRDVCDHNRGEHARRRYQVANAHLLAPHPLLTARPACCRCCVLQARRHGSANRGGAGGGSAAEPVTRCAHLSDDLLLPQLLASCGYTGQ